jgi:uncharacterized protein
MKIAISGSTGLIGSALKKHFIAQGHQVSEITRHRLGNRRLPQIYLNYHKNFIDAEALEGQDVIIHLAGANISGKRWSYEYKREIYDSRVKSTKVLVEAIKKMNRRPKVFLCASAVGYYGNRDPNTPVNERSHVGKGFLSKVCHEWENASADLVLFGVRSVYLRFGVVLSKRGGALARMLLPFYLGLGGRLGPGTQKMSWTTPEEIVSMVDFILSQETISGPVNMVSPFPVSNREFTKALGKVIFRPTILPMPSFIVRLIFGEMGQELLLEGCHATPEALETKGYVFKYPKIEAALKRVIKGKS